MPFFEGVTVLVYVDRAANAYGRMKMCHMVADKKTERLLAVPRIVASIREFDATKPSAGDRQDMINGLRDKYRDIPGVLEEALEITGQ